MYLSKIMLTGTACRNPYEMHRLLWQLFPPDADANRDFLFRVERSGQQHAEILLQSKRQPCAETDRMRILANRDYTLRLRNGQRIQFLLVANPVKTISDERGRKNVKGAVKKCRVPLIREKEQRAWLERKLNDCAQIETLVIDPKLPLNFRKGKGYVAGKIQPLSFQGVLTVKQASAFEKLVVAGVGPAKAFGCGLLSIANAN